jgi:hypothetical protein
MSPVSHRDEKQTGLPKGYELETAGDTLILKRPNGFQISAFGKGVRIENILYVAEADERYMRAVDRQEKFGAAADSETVLLFAEDVRESRTEFLLALETAYRGEDASQEVTPPPAPPPRFAS